MFTDQEGNPVLIKKGSVVAVFMSDKLKNKMGQVCSVLSLDNGKDIVVSEQIVYIQHEINAFFEGLC